MAIFDLTAYNRPLPPDIAAQVAAVGYELGVALAIGRPVAVVANQGQGLPFDVDVEAVRLAQDGEDERRLSRALDEAVYGLQRGGGDSSVDETLSYVRQHMAGEAPTYARIALEQIDESTEADPLKVRDILSAALGYAGPEAPQILYPTWPGDYPALHERRCFHVTAFGPDWANEAMALVREACQRAEEDIRYIRGDQVLSPDIIRSIWDEICRASHIVVDLTGLNINAVLELGMAHALGRNVLLITQDERPEQYFRAIAKTRMHRYVLDEPAGLNQVLDAFLEKDKE
jgi:nucleoside 2-deoxyribosyltransferase